MTTGLLGHVTVKMITMETEIKDTMTNKIVKKRKKGTVRDRRERDEHLVTVMILPLKSGRVNKHRVKGHQLIVIVHLLHKRGRRKLKRWRNIKSLQRDKKLAEIKTLEENIVRSHRTHPVIVAVNQSLLLHLLNASVVHLHHL